MKSRWSDAEASGFAARTGGSGGDLALRVYSARLLGAEPALVMHGGGNCSMKGLWTDGQGRMAPALFVKASGHGMEEIGEEGFPALDMGMLVSLRGCESLSHEAMREALLRARFRPGAPLPSIEALVHVFLPAKFIDHTHAEAVLALSNQKGGEEHLKKALGEDVIVLDYRTPGFDLARATAEAFEARPGAKGMVWMRHGLLAWGETAKESYERMLELVTRAEEYIAQRRPSRPPQRPGEPAEEARRRWVEAAPALRGALAAESGDPDRPWRSVVLRALLDEGTRAFVDAAGNRALALAPPLTPDHVIRTGIFPLWLENPDWTDMEKFSAQVREAVARCRGDYQKYLARHSGAADGEAAPGMPRVLLIPGLGAVCAGADAREAEIAADIMEQTLRVKAMIASMGEYEGLAEEKLFAMETMPMQRDKIARDGAPLRGRVALVTGAAGAIGGALCRRLLEEGAHVAGSDLPGPRLDSLRGELGAAFGKRFFAVEMDVAGEESVKAGLEQIVERWGGVDAAVLNAGVAAVEPLSEMTLKIFRRLWDVNAGGALLLLRGLAGIFSRQGTGGDVVLVSSKNVFAPGAQFGAYSASKAAMHQLGRVASLEFAPLDVRVNMVSPDAVFGDEARPSGLWEEVGPARMQARGMDAGELREYYRNRNLLKTEVLPRHVANAALFFLTRQTPTTGATLPVDGGLPEAAPR